jgi:hypothetical protein
MLQRLLTRTGAQLERLAELPVGGAGSVPAAARSRLGDAAAPARARPGDGLLDALGVDATPARRCMALVNLVASRAVRVLAGARSSVSRDPLLRVAERALALDSSPRVRAVPSGEDLDDAAPVLLARCRAATIR